MQVGRKQKLKTGDEVDFVCARGSHFKNDTGNRKRKIKRGLNKRYRRENKISMMEGVE